MTQRQVVNLSSKVMSSDIESLRSVGHDSSKKVSLAGVPLNIQPYSPAAKPGISYHSGKASQHDGDDLRRIAVIGGLLWLGGCLFGYGLAWPLYLFFDLLWTIVTTSPFSWFFGWLKAPLLAIFGDSIDPATPLVSQSSTFHELKVPVDQISDYIDKYRKEYGDGALIFASNDGVPQVVSGLLNNFKAGYRHFVNAVDDNGNTALMYAAAKGFTQCVLALIQASASPDIAGHSGRTPLMEAAGLGFTEVVAAMRPSASVDKKDTYGNTALHYAAYHGYLPVVEELFKSNPTRDVKNRGTHGCELC